MDAIDTAPHGMPHPNPPGACWECGGQNGTHKSGCSKK